jgi:antitoxin component YwqK of YwqJK toxin-antitoxin module
MAPFTSLPDGPFDYIIACTGERAQGCKKGNSKDGLYREWHTNGKLALEATYVNGTLHGVYRRWYTTGKPLYSMTYKNGELSGEFFKWSLRGVVLENRVY